MKKFALGFLLTAATIIGSAAYNRDALLDHLISERTIVANARFGGDCAAMLCGRSGGAIIRSTRFDGGASGTPAIDFR